MAHPALTHALPGLPAPAGAAAPAAARSTVARWRREVTLFAAAVSVLVVLVAAGSAAALWWVLGQATRVEQDAYERGQAAVTARLAVLDVDRLLVQTIAAQDPASARRAAVASIAAASRLEDAITALLKALPDDANAVAMRRLVDDINAPRVQVIVHTREGRRAEALAALESIGEPLRKIDQLSAALLEVQSAERGRAAAAREMLLRRLVPGLLAAAGIGLAIGWLFYRRLMSRFARADQVERLLEEVGRTVAELDADGKQLARLNTDVGEANTTLAALLRQLRASCGAMLQEAQASVAELEQVSEACQRSAGTSREHAAEAGAVAQQIRTTSERMHRLLDTSRALGASRSEIAGFADQIARIAATTRLLALNAGVEAARAGHTGRGFSVIASSVRQLAEDTHKAAVHIRRASDDITRQLAGAGEAIQQASGEMDGCAQRIGALDASARANQQIADGMAGDVRGFRASFQRQVDRIGTMERQSGALDEALRDGRRHAQLLEETAHALARASASLHQRLSGVQA